MNREIHHRETNGNASQFRIGIVVATFNSDITMPMLSGAKEVLRKWNVVEDNITVQRVPGSFEIPYGCRMMLEERRYDALIALGCIIKGATKHDEYIATATTQGIMQLMLTYGVPIGYGILTTENLAQAQVRSVGESNRGSEAAHAVLSLLTKTL